MAIAMAMAMAMAMASTGSNFGLCTNLKASEQKPISRTAPFRCFKGLDSVQKPCIIPMRRSSFLKSLSVPKPKASHSPTTAMEVSNSHSLLECTKQGETSHETGTLPTPVVIIDQDSDSDPHATVVEITFGDRLGALLHTIDSRKVDEPDLLEAIRLTIINNLLQYHPESSAQLAMGAAFGVTPPNQMVDVDIATRISIKDDGPE